MRTAPKLRTWSSPVDRVTSLVGAAALITYELHGFGGVLDRDLAVYSYGAQQVVDGVPPYVSILNRAGPLAHLIPAIGVLGARLGGIDDLLGMRLLFMLIAVACVCLVYLVGRDLFESPLAGLAAAAAFLSFSGFIEFASNGPREKTPMVLFLLCALLAVTKHRWLAAGVSVSLATLVWQPAFFVGLPAIAVAVLALRPAERTRALLRVAVGGLLPAVGCFLYFAAVGALRAFIDAFVLINLRYTVSQPLTFGDLAHHWAQLQNGFGLSLWVIVTGITAILILPLKALSKEERRRNPAAISVAGVGAAALSGVAWTTRDFDNWPDALVLLPLAALGVGAIVKVLTDHLPPRTALSITIAWVTAAASLALTYSVTERDHTLPVQRRSVSAMFERLPSDATLLAINAPQALVLSGKSNPTRHQMISSGLDRYIDDTWPGGLEGFAKWIGREQPTVIAIGGQVPPWLAETVNSEYQRAGSAPRWTWYVHRSVAQDVISSLRGV